MIDQKFLHSTEAEQMVIGAILIDHDNFYAVNDLIESRHFFNAQHRIIFGAMELLNKNNEQPELFMVADVLQRKIPKFDWAQELALLAKNTPSTKNVADYAKRVYEYFIIRKWLEVGTAIEKLVIDLSETPETRIQNIENCVFEFGKQRVAYSGPQFANYYLREAVDDLEKRYCMKDGVIGIRAGFKSIDQRLGGLKPGSLTLLAARPSMGKTNMGLNIATNASVLNGVAVLFFSLEMTGAELVTRITSNIGPVDYGKLNSGDMGEDDWPKYTNAIAKIKESKLIIDETASLTIEKISSRSRVEYLHHKIELIVVDHIGLIAGKGENQTQILSNISRQLKVMAKQLNIPVIALSQLNRSLEQRQDKRPMLSDLRQSGSLEQDADNVGFIYWDGYYNPNTAHPEIIELIWAKVRGGKIGTDYFLRQFDYCRFSETKAPNDYGAEIVPFNSTKKPHGKDFKGGDD